MKKGISIMLVICFLATLAGCGAKDDTPTTSASGSGTASENTIGEGITSNDMENNDTPVEVNNSHEAIKSSTFEVNGVRFWHHDNIGMECFVFQDRFSEITVNGIKVHIDVNDKEDSNDLYEYIVSYGDRGVSTSGDLYHQNISDVIWEIATDSGKFITIYGDKDSDEDWKSVAQMIEWTVIGAEQSDTEMDFNVSSDQIDHSDEGFTIKDGLFEPTNGNTLSPAGQPLTVQGITLSDVLLSDTYEYRGDPENSDLAEKAYYDFYMISTEMGVNEWGLIPFLSYLVPSDATITFYPSDENKSFYIGGYNVFPEENGEGWKQTYIGGFKCTAEDTEPIVFTLNDLREYLPDFVHLICSADNENWVDVMFVN